MVLFVYQLITVTIFISVIDAQAMNNSSAKTINKDLMIYNSPDHSLGLNVYAPIFEPGKNKTFRRCMQKCGDISSVLSDNGVEQSMISDQAIIKIGSHDVKGRLSNGDKMPDSAKLIIKKLCEWNGQKGNDKLILHGSVAILLNIVSIYGATPNIYPRDWDFKINRRSCSDFFKALGADENTCEFLLKLIENEGFCSSQGYTLEQNYTVIGVSYQWKILSPESDSNIFFYIKIMRSDGYPVSTITLIIPVNNGKPCQIDVTLCESTNQFETRGIQIDEFGVFPVIHPRYLVYSFSYMLNPRLDPSLDYAQLSLAQQEKVLIAGNQAFIKSEPKFKQWIELEETTNQAINSKILKSEDVTKMREVLLLGADSFKNRRSGCEHQNLEVRVAASNLTDNEKQVMSMSVSDICGGKKIDTPKDKSKKAMFSENSVQKKDAQHAKLENQHQVETIDPEVGIAKVYLESTGGNRQEQIVKSKVYNPTGKAERKKRSEIRCANEKIGDKISRQMELNTTSPCNSENQGNCVNTHHDQDRHSRSQRNLKKDKTVKEKIEIKDESCAKQRSISENQEVMQTSILDRDTISCLATNIKKSETSNIIVKEIESKREAEGKVKDDPREKHYDNFPCYIANWNNQGNQGVKGDIVLDSAQKLSLSSDIHEPETPSVVVQTTESKKKPNKKKKNKKGVSDQETNEATPSSVDNKPQEENSKISRKHKKKSKKDQSTKQLNDDEILNAAIKEVEDELKIHPQKEYEAEKEKRLRIRRENNSKKQEADKNKVFQMTDVDNKLLLDAISKLQGKSLIEGICQTDDFKYDSFEEATIAEIVGIKRMRPLVFSEKLSLTWSERLNLDEVVKFFVWDKNELSLDLHTLEVRVENIESVGEFQKERENIGRSFFLFFLDLACESIQVNSDGLTIFDLSEKRLRDNQYAVVHLLEHAAIYGEPHARFIFLTPLKAKFIKQVKGIPGFQRYRSWAIKAAITHSFEDDYIDHLFTEDQYIQVLEWMKRSLKLSKNYDFTIDGETLRVLDKTEIDRDIKRYWGDYLNLFHQLKASLFEFCKEKKLSGLEAVLDYMLLISCSDNQNRTFQLCVNFLEALKILEKKTAGNVEKKLLSRNLLIAMIKYKYSGSSVVDQVKRIISKHNNDEFLEEELSLLLLCCAKLYCSDNQDVSVFALKKLFETAKVRKKNSQSPALKEILKVVDSNAYYLYIYLCQFPIVYDTQIILPAAKKLAEIYKLSSETIDEHQKRFAYHLSCILLLMNINSPEAVEALQDINPKYFQDPELKKWLPLPEVSPCE